MYCYLSSFATARLGVVVAADGARVLVQGSAGVGAAADADALGNAAGAVVAGEDGARRLLRAGASEAESTNARVDRQAAAVAGEALTGAGGVALAVAARQSQYMITTK